ncbi:hypothetical protein EJB05_05036, partial [Eragrostis curvula]
MKRDGDIRSFFRKTAAKKNSSSSPSIPSTEKRQIAAISGLTDDLLVDILSRVPIKTLCCCKCVSPSWRDLISNPAHRKKLPQTLFGFFYFDEFETCQFVSLVAPKKGQPRSPSPVDFSFLPGDGQVLDCCNGLVLLNCWTGSGSTRRGTYVVCHPATKKCVAVPEPTETGKKCFGIRLCFDPAVSWDFHVVRLLDEKELDAEEDGRWESWDEPGIYFLVLIFIHLILDTGFSVQAKVGLHVAVRTERTLYLPQVEETGFIGHSQGHLFYANKDDRNPYRILVYALEDYGSGRWTLKHSINASEIYASARQHLQSALQLEIAAIHPHCNLIYLVDCSYGTLISYNMDNRSVRDIRPITGICLSFAPYVPFYLEIAALENGN